jgi:ATP-binding cassette subfamily B protein
MIMTHGWRFSSLLLLTFVLYAIHTNVFIRRRALRQRRVNALELQAHRRLVDSLLNFETVKSYANERFESDQLGDILRRSVAAGVDNQVALTALHIGQSAAIAIGIAAVMLMAGSAIASGELTVGDLVLVNAYVIRSACVELSRFRDPRILGCARACRESVLAAALATGGTPGARRHGGCVRRRHPFRRSQLRL